MATGPTAAVAQAPVGQGFNLNASDLRFILKQIKIAEQHADTVSASTPCSTMRGTGPDQVPAGEVGDTLPWGLRQVDGRCNNIVAGRDAFGAAFLAVLVPPWNRVEPALIARLAGFGFCGLSTFGRRPNDAAAGLPQVNTHLDPVDWRGSRLFIGEAAALERLCGALDPEEPIGILSHHLVMDEDGWFALVGRG